MSGLAGILPFQIHVYGVLLAMAFAGGIGMGIHLSGRFGMTVDQIIDLAIVFMFSAMLGSRLLYIFLYPQQFQDVWSWFALNRGGLVFFGGFLATVAAVVLFGKWHHISLRVLGDLIAPSLALGHTIGRLGCFANGCCYGAATDLPWACRFTTAGDSLLRHPTQLYEAAFLFAAMIVTYKLLVKRASTGYPPAGFIWGGYVASYGLFRFMIEFLRDDDRGGFFTPLHLSVSQLVGLGAMAAAVVWMLLCSRRAQPAVLSNVPLTNGAITK